MVVRLAEHVHLVLGAGWHVCKQLTGKATNSASLQLLFACCRDGTLITMFQSVGNDTIARRLMSKLEVRKGRELLLRQGVTRRPNSASAAHCRAAQKTGHMHALPGLHCTLQTQLCLCMDSTSLLEPWY
jgi:hypothetical protein